VRIYINKCDNMNNSDRSANKSDNVIKSDKGIKGDNAEMTDDIEKNKVGNDIVKIKTIDLNNISSVTGQNEKSANISESNQKQKVEIATISDNCKTIVEESKTTDAINIIPNTAEQKPKTLNATTVMEIMNDLARVGAPGLNDVLLQYNASHGLNGLKELMKERFNKMPREYFYARPIDKEYLIYSAKDVEDLVEVKEKMVERLWGLLRSVGVEVEREKIVVLCKKASRTYSLHGCLSLKEKHKDGNAEC